MSYIGERYTHITAAYGNWVITGALLNEVMGIRATVHALEMGEGPRAMLFGAVSVGLGMLVADTAINRDLAQAAQLNQPTGAPGIPPNLQ